MTATKLPVMPAPGPVGRNVIANVERSALSAACPCGGCPRCWKRPGRPIPVLGLSRMFKAERRVDVDEAVALAEVLGVTPDVLLAPPDSAPPPEHRALRAAEGLAGHIAALLGGSGDAAELSGYVDRARRRVEIEVEELLEQAKASAS